MFKRVLLCYDGTMAGRRALLRGAELAVLLNSEEHVLSILQAESPSAAVMAGASGHACLIDEEQEDRKLVLGHYPRPVGGFWWTSRNRASLADRVRCCVFVAVVGPPERDGG
jgi:hypothetical protein